MRLTSTVAKKTNQVVDPATPSTWPHLLTLRDLQILTPWGHSKLQRMAADGELPAKKVRGGYVITKDSFLAWLKKR